jgi:hypothetical protein
MNDDFQFFVDVIMALVALLGGWLFKVMFSNSNKQRDELQELCNRQREDYRKLSDEMVTLALSLPDKYVTKDDFTRMSEQLQDRFDKLEYKIDNLRDK